MGVEDSPARYLAEFLGTYILVLTVGCNVLSGQPIWGGVSIACSLTVMIYALGKSSGANFNPAVSLALGINKTLTWTEVAIYMVCQFLGGIVGGLTYLAMFVDAFNLQPTAGHGLWQAALAEIFYTFMLVFVILNVAVTKKAEGKQFYGLAIGFVIVAGAYSGGAISMGCFNPAVALGIDLISVFEGFGNCFWYTLFEFVGAVVAVVLFWVVRPDEPGALFKIAASEPGKVPLVSRLVSEFLGTFMLVLTVGLNVLGGSTAGAFSIAASLMCMIYALGDVSGANFNPAVTMAIVCSRRGVLSTADGAMFVVAQISGGIVAAFTYSAMKGGQSFALKPEPSAWSQVLVAEFAFTFVLAFVVLSVATVKDPLTEYFGFAIGMCVTVGGCAIGKISGGSLNPAVSIGISASHAAKGGFAQCLGYTVIELLAGVAAAGMFQVTQPSEFSMDEKDGKA